MAAPNHTQAQFSSWVEVLGVDRGLLSPRRAQSNLLLGKAVRKVFKEWERLRGERTPLESGLLPGNLRHSVCCGTGSLSSGFAGNGVGGCCRVLLPQEEGWDCRARWDEAAKQHLGASGAILASFCARWLSFSTQQAMSVPGTRSPLPGHITLPLPPH